MTIAASPTTRAQAIITIESLPTGLATGGFA